MTLAGTYRNGVVVFDQAPPLADGTRVEVVVPAAQQEQPTLHDLLELAGTVKGLPPDMADQHDHYIHRTPKR